ncbi:hypothetical protein G6F66_013040 [Rhizopus arrhizus]|nr:hypothetical protein G6F66_013040 [Rhizopus arrhizus]
MAAAGGHCAPPLSGTSREPHSPPTASLAGAADVGRHRCRGGQQLLRAATAAHHRRCLRHAVRPGRHGGHRSAAELCRRADPAGAAGRPVRTPPPDRGDEPAVGGRPGDQRLRTVADLAAGGHRDHRPVLGGGAGAGAVRRHAGRAGASGQGGRHADEWPAAGHPAVARGQRFRGRTVRLARDVRGGCRDHRGAGRRALAGTAAFRALDATGVPRPAGIAGDLVAPASRAAARRHGARSAVPGLQCILVDPGRDAARRALPSGCGRGWRVWPGRCSRRPGRSAGGTRR